MSSPSLRQLEYAVALADHLHFGEAAAASFVTQPALSAQIRELESRLGVELFERRTTGTTLTPAGLDVIERARAILSTVGELNRVAAAHHGTVRGSLRIGAIPTVAPYLLPSIVDGIRSTWPDAHLALEELQSDDLLAALDAADLDVGVLATPYETGRLHVEPLGQESFALAVPSGHPLAASDEPLPVDALADLHVLLLPDGHCLGDHARQVCDTAGRVDHNYVKAGSIATLVRMVAIGVGVTLLPASARAVEVRPGSGIAIRAFAEPAPGRTIALAWRSSDPRHELFGQLTSVLRAEIDAVISPH